MKITVHGVRYDTEKSTLIGTATAAGDKTDLHYWSESLYLTPRSGRWFVAGQGGPLSHWSRPTGDGHSDSGQGIRPISQEVARRWLQENHPDLVREHFKE